MIRRAEFENLALVILEAGASAEELKDLIDDLAYSLRHKDEE